jgi:hypothetical protein
MKTRRGRGEGWGRGRARAAACTVSAEEATSMVEAGGGVIEKRCREEVSGSAGFERAD